MATFGRADVTNHDLFARDQGIGAIIHLRPTAFPRRASRALPRSPTHARHLPSTGMQGVSVLLVALSLAATLLGGFARAPWWFWLVGAAALALLIATDPNRFRASYADTRGLDTVPLLLGDLKSLSIGCLMSAAAFALGVALSWLLRL
jgi:4-hydroxybenzoate polyprenyltransferase